MAAMAVLSGQMARSADFILPRIRSLSAAKPSQFYQGLAKQLAVLSRPTAVAVLWKGWQSEWQLYQGPPAAAAVLSKPMAVSSSFINNGRFTKVEDQASGRNGCFINQKRPNGLC